MTDPFHLVVGAGPVGTALALRLADAGSRVRVVTRSGGGPSHPLVERTRSTRATPTASPRPHAGVRRLQLRERRAVPGLGARLAAARRIDPARRRGIRCRARDHGQPLRLRSRRRADAARYPLRPSDHKGVLRARMWEEALAAHDAGRVRVTGGARVGLHGTDRTESSGLLPMYAAATLAGRPATVFGDPDAPHSWTAVDDIAATLEVLGRDERAWGSAWLVPSNPPVSVREVLRALGQRAGTGEPRLRRMPRWVLAAGGTVVPIMREVTGVLYQFERPFVVDASETTETFGVSRPTGTRCSTRPRARGASAQRRNDRAEPTVGRVAP